MHIYHIHKTGMKGGQETGVENKVLMLAPVNIGIKELKTMPFRYPRLPLLLLLNIVGLFGRK